MSRLNLASGSDARARAVRRRLGRERRRATLGNHSVWLRPASHKVATRSIASQSPTRRPGGEKAPSLAIPMVEQW
jgi:hypothetical protein